MHNFLIAYFQDLISRFTLDSATEFLFGTCVHSLQSTLPYPHHSPLHLSQRSTAPTDDFARAFAQIQEVLNFRLRMGCWIFPWFELFGDKTKAPMRVVDSLLNPILEAAIKKAQQVAASGPQEAKGEIGEDETLLDYLVKHTQGRSNCCPAYTFYLQSG